jgi:hypothetical protein
MTGSLLLSLHPAELARVGNDPQVERKQPGLATDDAARESRTERVIRAIREIRGHLFNHKRTKERKHETAWP